MDLVEQKTQNFTRIIEIYLLFYIFIVNLYIRL